MARPGRAFESRIRVKEDGRAAFSERQNARLSWPRFDSIDEPKSPCRPSSNRRSPCHLHRSTVKKINIYIYIFLLVHIAIKKGKNFASLWNDERKSNRIPRSTYRWRSSSSNRRGQTTEESIKLLTREEGSPWKGQSKRNTRHVYIYILRVPALRLNPRRSRSEFSTMPLVNRA